MKTKICTKCNLELPMTNEYFNKRITSKDGFRAECKMCMSEWKKEHYQKNRTYLKNRSKKNYENNKEEILTKSKIYYRENKEKIIERRKPYMKMYEQLNRDTIAIRKKIYRQNNIKYFKEKARKYREENKEHCYEYKKQYIIKNKQKVYAKARIYNKNRASKKLNLPHTLTFTQWEEIKVYFENRCAYCNKELPLEQEHFLALSKGGEYTNNNIIPSCKSCNCSKGNKDFFEWYPKYKYYSKKREIKILKYLHYDSHIQQLAII